ncbi:MAG: 4Fe-4S binding protein [Bacteroidales bacterium]|nr:4Fe-4S binding protein [Bacteroidales bacterium]
METRHFHHALRISEELCTGCSHCMSVCPTEAIRVRKGKAILYENRCVDCGECFKVCPVKAINIDHDDFSRISTFKHRIALVPAVFIGQFPENISRELIYRAILACGFTQIYEVELGTILLVEQIRKYAEENPGIKPLISSFCPAIIRLIQVKFPSLVNNIMLLKPPLDITALYCRKLLTDQGVNPAEVGVFYFTPCAAKIAAIKSPVGEDYSMITGVINMDFIYNKVNKIIKNGLLIDEIPVPNLPLPGYAVRWTLTHGESDNIPGRCLAIDEIHNVIEFLEKVENEEISDIDFLELRACDESCAGGALNTTNRFLITERLRKKQPEIESIDNNTVVGIHQYEEYLQRRIFIKEIKPRSMMKLDEDMAEAMRKMDKVQMLMQVLPKTDCGACGSPNCQAFANDIVQGEASIRQCIFVQKSREHTGELTPEESLQILKEIWGNDKF